MGLCLFMIIYDQHFCTLCSALSKSLMHNFHEIDLEIQFHKQNAFEKLFAYCEQWHFLGDIFRPPQCLLTTYVYTLCAEKPCCVVIHEQPLMANDKCCHI